MINAGEAERLAHQTELQVQEVRNRTNAIAASEAMRLLGLERAQAEKAGYNLIRQTPSGRTRLQIIGAILPSPILMGPLGPIDINQDWDAVLLVLMDHTLKPMKIFDIPRTSVIDALSQAGAAARGECDRLSVQLICRLPLALQVWLLLF